MEEKNRMSMSGFYAAQGNLELTSGSCIRQCKRSGTKRHDLISQCWCFSWKYVINEAPGPSLDLPNDKETEKYAHGRSYPFNQEFNAAKGMVFFDVSEV